MTLVYDYPLTSTFAGVNTLQADGTINTGNNLPNGIGTRLIIENGVMKSTISQSDTVTALGIRSEITAPANTFAEWWYVFEFMLPEDFFPTNVPIMLMQIHDTPDEGDPARAVPFSFWYAQDNTLQTYIPAATLPTEGVNSTLLNRINFNRGKWYKACLHANWKTDATGFIEFFINGIALFRRFNTPTAYSDVTGNYFKCGLYDGTGGANFGEVSAFYRNVKIYSGNDGYATVMGSNLINPSGVLEL